MASPQDGLDQDMLLFWWQPELWAALRSVWDRPQPIDRSEGEKLLECYDQALTSLDRACEGTKFESSFKDQLDLKRFASDLKCDHNPGVSFSLSHETIALCLHVANVICFNCFLLCSGISLEMYKDAGSVMDISDLTDKLSRFSQKWKWSGDCENKTHRLWESHISEEEAEEAVKLLYQWTLRPFSAINAVDVVRPGHVGSVLDTETYRVMKEDEKCKFLEDYNMFFSIGEVNIGFLYKEFSDWFCHTASLYCHLGNYARAGELLEKARQKLKEIDDDTMVTKWGSSQYIVYLPRLEPILKFQRELHVLNLLDEVNISKNQDRRFILNCISEKQMQIFKEAESKFEWDLKKFLSEHGLTRFTYEIQLYETLNLIGDERYSEAGETFKQLNDLNQCRSNGVLRDFLEHLNLNTQKWISGSGSPLTWESACEKQNLLLDLCEYLDDHQLTAKCLQQYGIMIGERSFGKLPKQNRGIAEAFGISIGKSGAHEEASTLKLWLEEELSLQLPWPAPECVQEVISCLRDRWISNEHKLKRPEMIKACRLLKRSIDIYSDLLHNWTPTISNEVQWLLLLESQKSVYETFIAYLLTIDRFCIVCVLEINDPSYTHRDVMRSVNSVLSGTGESFYEAFKANVFTAFSTSALVWVERGRTRTLLNQLGPWYNVMKHGDGNPGSDSLKEQLIKFDNDEQAAMSSILSCQTACKGSVPLFVEYVCLGRTIVAFIIDNNTTCVRICSYEADRVEILVKKFNDTVCQQKKHNDEKIVAKLHSCLGKLYDMLIGPFWEQASLIERDPKASLVIVPAKILYRVPIALLRDGKTKKYLFELHTISIAPSLRVLQHCKDRLDDLDRFPLKPEGCILAVGDPAYVKNPLPGTGIELKDLQSCFDGMMPLPGTGKEPEHDQPCLPRRVKTLKQDEATRAKFLKEVGKGDVLGFIHLGVHGHWSINGENKTGSLQFAPPQTSEGGDSKFATTCSDHGGKHGSVFGEVGSVMPEVERGSNSSAAEDMLPSEDVIRSGFQWRTRLVVLSACNSSRGTDYTDCEVNLPRALMIAGVPATVVSQWKVGDSGNPPLMKAFYEFLKGGYCVASALRSAMLQIYESDKCASKIFEWGPFVVWGLPTVQLSKELWSDGMKAEMFYIQKVNTLLESARNKQTLTDEAIHDAICSIERLLVTLSSDCRIIAAAEIVYTVVPLEHLKRFELQLETACGESKQLFDFRAHVMYAQAMKGSPEVALDYINKIIEVVVSRFKCSYDELYVQTYRQERAVIWRLMGMQHYRAALDEFNELLKFGEDYECLAQASYLMALMEDKRGALEYAHRAKKAERSDMSGYSTNMSLGVKAFPGEYRWWLLNVDENTLETSCPVELSRGDSTHAAGYVHPLWG